MRGSPPAYHHTTTKLTVAIISHGHTFLWTPSNYHTGMVAMASTSQNYYAYPYHAKHTFGTSDGTYIPCVNKVACRRHFFFLVVEITLKAFTSCNSQSSRELLRGDHVCLPRTQRVQWPERKLSWIVKMCTKKHIRGRMTFAFFSHFPLRTI